MSQRLNEALKSGELERVINATDIAGIHPSLKLLCVAARKLTSGETIHWCRAHESSVLAGLQVCDWWHDVPEEPADPCEIVGRTLL